MAGVLTYFAVFMLTTLWVLGWAGVSFAAGAFFSLPMKTTILAGAVLGPLGLVVTIVIGVLERGSRSGAEASPVSSPGTTVEWDRFS